MSVLKKFLLTLGLIVGAFGVVLSLISLYTAKETAPREHYAGVRSRAAEESSSCSQGRTSVRPCCSRFRCS